MVITIILISATILFSACTPTKEDVVTYAHFDKLQQQVQVGQKFTLNVQTSGNKILFVSLDETMLKITFKDNVIYAHALKAGTTRIVAVDENGVEYNSCSVIITQNPDDSTNSETPPDTDTTNPDPQQPTENNSGMIYDRYNINTYTYPFWHGNTVYNETVLFVGNTDAAPLLYKASRILKVTSFDLKTTYEEGKDYTYDKQNNLLLRTLNSSIPAWDPAHWVMTADYAQQYGGDNKFPAKDGKFVYYAEGKNILENQIAITYEHDEYAPTKWKLPITMPSAFEKLKSKLENKRQVEILYYGDSVVFGANASGMIGLSPNAPSYTDMITSFIKTKYPETNIVYQNNATGGITAGMALDHFPNRTPYGSFQTQPCTITPDLIVLGFGLNDGQDVTAFVKNIENLVLKAREEFPNCEILIASPSLANSNVFDCLETQKESRLRINFFPNNVAKYPGVAIAQVTKMYNQVYNKKGNRYQDITGNNVNHPNDMGMRVIAQTCLETIFGSDWYK